MLNQLSIFQHTNQDEIWIETYVSKDYLVSNYGRVYSIKTNKFLKHGTCTEFKYKTVVIHPSPKICMIHLLVYHSFNKTKPIQGFHVDHIDRNPLNNKLQNLRQVTQRQNHHNRKNQSIYGVGVSKQKGCVTKPFLATISINKNKIYLGHFETQEEANQAYQLKKQQIESEKMDCKLFIQNH
jgi:hypothetical protein